MTPRELMLIVEEYNHRLLQKREDMIIQAYFTAAWHRARRMPRLKKVLEDIRDKTIPKAQTPEQMLQIVKKLHSAMTKGG